MVSSDELSPIFFTPHYFVMLTINVVLCVTINGVIDYFVNRDKAAFYVMNGANAINMIIFSLILSLISFAGGGAVHKRILEGKAMPVTRRALCDTCFKKVICFSMQEPSWKKRIFLFMWNAFLFPGVFLALAVSLLCMFATGFSSLGQTDSCPVSEAANIVVIECWKAVGAAILFSMSYAAAHNEEQPELAGVTNPIMASALGENDIYASAP